MIKKNKLQTRRAANKPHEDPSTATAGYISVADLQKLCRRVFGRTIMQQLSRSEQQEQPQNVANSNSPGITKSAGAAASYDRGRLPTSKASRKLLIPARDVENFVEVTI